MDRVRRAELADVDQIAAVHRLSRADYYGIRPDEHDDRAAMWQHFLGEPNRITYVAEGSDEILAVMSAQRPADPVEVLELSAVYVHPAHFGRGIGSRLYDVFDAERKPSEAGVLEVWAGNRRAIDFYERRGWTPTSTTRPGPQDLPFVTYRLAVRTDVG